MINNSTGIDNGDISTWREGEKVEAVLITERGPGNLIKVSHPDAAFYIPADKFASVHPVDGADPDYPATVKALRTKLVEERLAAAEERSKTAMANRRVNELYAELRRLHAASAAVMRAHRLAMAALRHIHELDSQGPLPPLPFLDVLLGDGERPGSVAEPCNAELMINAVYPGCGCEEPCMTEVARHPCMLVRGHFLVRGKELHRTVAGREFETGEAVLVDDDGE